MSRPLSQILQDCPNCRVEGALVELLGGDHAEGECRLCGQQTRDAAVIRPGRRFHAVEDVREALAAWGIAEGDPDLRRFVVNNFLDGELDTVVDRILSGEPVGTNFDVLGWLMPGLGGGANVRGGPPVLAVTPSPEEPARVRPDPIDPDAAAIAMRSVAWADGELHPAERNILTAAGIPHDRPQVTRPTECGRPAQPAGVVRELIRLALADGVVDASEVRVIQEFARAWGVPFDPAVLPLGGAVQRTFKAIVGSFV